MVHERLRIFSWRPKTYLIEMAYNNFDKFRIWKHPIYFLCLGYTYIELSNPILASIFQVIPKIPNSAITVIICYFLVPKFIKGIKAPLDIFKISLPLLIIAFINLPFISDQTSSMQQLAATFFYMFFFVPQIVKILSTKTGRDHFIIFNTIGTIIICIQFYISINMNLFFKTETIEFSRNHLIQSVAMIFPLLIVYAFQLKGYKKILPILCLLLIILASIPSGSRTLWIILPLELILLYLFVLPKNAVFAWTIAISFSFFIIFSVFGISDFYSENAIYNLQFRIRKLVELADPELRDNTVLKRYGMIRKTLLILDEYPLLGVGYSNRSFAEFDAGSVFFGDRLIKLGKTDAHNSYLNLIGGTGLLGLAGLLYFLIKIFPYVKLISKRSIKIIDCGSFLISSSCVLILLNTTTAPFHIIALYLTIPYSIFLMQYNQFLYNTNNKRISNV